MITAQLLKTAGDIPLINLALRRVANFYPENSLVRIRSGHAAGLLWRRHHRYVNGYWLGHYEFAIQEALRRELKPGQRFFDLGANAGFFTLLAARLVGPGGHCVAFDPSPENAASVREQLELNEFHHCTVVQEALGDEDGTASFSFPVAGSPIGHLGQRRGAERQVEVKTVCLDSASARFGEPDFVKMDVEGAEAMVLRGAQKLLCDKRPKWLIELHGPQCEHQVKCFLLAASYDFFDLAGNSLSPARLLPQHFVAVPTRD